MSCAACGRLASGIGANTWRSASELIWIAPRTRMVSYTVIMLNTQAIANSSEPIPARIAIAVDSDATKAVCDDGMPPAASRRCHAKVRVRTETSTTLKI